MSNKPNSKTISKVNNYIEQGFAVLPIRSGEKAPSMKSWQKLRINAENYTKYFPTDKQQNVGLILGKASNGLVDVDLDNPIARDLAKYFLPETNMVFGRKSSPKSHYMYLCNDIDKTIQLRTKDLGMIVEIRANGGQTVVPPSIHKSGEEISFINEEYSPSQVNADELIKQVHKLAAATVLIENYPTEGNRNKTFMPIASILLKSGMSDEEAKQFIEVVARYAKDDEYSKRADVVAHTQKRIANGENTSGIPTLKQSMDKQAVDDFCKFLKLKIATISTDDIESKIAELNKEYAFAITGAKSAILKLNTDKTEPLHLMSTSAFKEYFSNQKVIVSYNENGKPNYQKLGHHWLEHPKRKDYKGIEFNPNKTRKGYYNIWQGFAISPNNNGSCDLYLKHIHDNVCSGNKEHSHWFIAWMADIVKNPAKKSGTAVVIRGQQGAGKSIVGNILGKLLEPYYVIASNNRYITGNFNSHLEKCLLLHAEEGFLAGDKKSSGVIKDLITGDKNLIERKGFEPISVKNYIRLLVTSNEEKVIPASMEERRFFVLETSNAVMQNHAYFESIFKQMENGGYEALMHYLLNYDLSKVNLRKIPKTQALLEQKLESLDSKHKWWLEILENGNGPFKKDEFDDEVALECTTDQLADSYVDYMTYGFRNLNAKSTSVKSMLGKFLPKIIPDIKNRKKRRGSTSYYVLPSLQECRKHFEDLINQQIHWED